VRGRLSVEKHIVSEEKAVSAVKEGTKHAQAALFPTL
jgi:hypothetical protein